MLSKSPVSATLQCRRKNLKAVDVFYSKKLGLKRVAGSPKEGFLLYLAGKRTEIMLFESDASKSNDTGATFEVADLARAMATLRKRGVRFEEYNLPAVKTKNGVAQMGPHAMAWMKDPDGNLLGMHQRK